MSKQVELSSEARRLEVLRSYQILDTLPEEALDNLTELTAQICEVPVAMISLVDERRQWFKSRVGTAMTQSPRDISFCAHTINKKDLFIVKDAALDERFAKSPLVTGESGIRFYAGAPLISPEGVVLGALCVNDRVPRILTPAQEQALLVLARQVMTHLELRRHTRELIESEERLRSVTDNAEVGLVIVNRDHSYMYANKTYAEILSLGSDKIVGRRLADVLPGLYETQIRPHLDQAFAGDQVAYELRKPAPEGDRYYAVRYEPTKVEDVVTVVVVVITEVTQRKMAELESERTNAELKLILDTVPALVFYKDLESRFVRVNQELTRLIGAPPEAFIGKTDTEMGVPQGERYRQDDLQVMTSGKPLRQLEEQVHTVDGIRWLLTDKFPHHDADGKIIGVIGFAVDITERKRGEMAALRLASIVEFSDDAIIGKDLNSIITSWNRGAEKIFGYTAAEMVGTSIKRLLPSDRLDEENYILGKIKQGESVEHFETVRQTKDGRLIHVSVTASPIKDAEGRVLGVSKVARDISERKEAENRLREREEQLRLYVEYSPAAIAMFDCDMKYLVASRSWMERYRLGDQSVVGRSHYEVFPEIPQRWKDIHQRCLKGAVEKCDEDAFLRSDGQTDWVRWEIRPWHEAGGDIGGIIIFSEDITQRKKAEQQLLWKTAFFEAQVYSALDGILIVDGGGNKILQNQRTADMWKIPAEFAKETDDRRQFEWVTAQMKNPGQFAEKVAYLHAHPDDISRDELELKDGRFFDRYSAPVRGPDGKYYGRIWTFRDITERKRTEERLAEQAAFLDKARDAILVRDLDGKILYWNEGACRMYGWTQEEAVGRNIVELLYADPQKFETVNTLTIVNGEWHGELQHLTKEGGEFSVEARWTLIRDNAGNAKSILAINTDITERKKMEAQFLRAQRMESIGTLAGGIAHDLNNILAPILMAIEILKQSNSTPSSSKILDAIEVSARRGADIVRQVLSFARGMEGQRVEVQTAHLLKDLENIIRDTFPKDIRQEFSIPTDTWTILGDPTQIHQILLNLTVNARDAMPDGGQLTIGVENSVLDEQYAAMNLQAKPGRYVVISVADSGVGISKSVQDKIFEPFFTTKELHKGTGLGLSTVMAIVKSHGGVINVYSEPGKGTTFKVYLPAVDGEAPEESALSEVTRLPRGNGETVLVVDDEASILTITSQTLEAFGYRVLTAMDGAEAVAIYAQRRKEIAVVLTDMMMPVMDGVVTIHALMRINPGIRIIAASGLNANGGTAKVSGAGVRHFLLKPYTADTLLKTLRTILEET